MRPGQIDTQLNNASVIMTVSHTNAEAPKDSLSGKAATFGTKPGNRLKVTIFGETSSHAVNSLNGNVTLENVRVYITPLEGLPPPADGYSNYGI